MLLQRGYSTRAAVRSASKGDSLRELLASEEGDKIENFEYVVVNDICDVRDPVRCLRRDALTTVLLI